MYLFIPEAVLTKRSLKKFKKFSGQQLVAIRFPATFFCLPNNSWRTSCLSASCAIQLLNIYKQFTYLLINYEFSTYFNALLLYLSFSKLSAHHSVERYES